MKSQAYQLPDNLEPENFFCAKVYIPDEPEYRRAFLGAYMYLSKWLAWERDENNSASVAAGIWREAVDLTMLDWEKGCGIMATCEEIQECINGIDLSGLVTVINNISCGGTGFIVIEEPGGDPVVTPPPLGDEPIDHIIVPPDGVTLPEEPIDVGTGDPPVGFDSWESYDSGACAAANSLVEFMYQSALRMALFSSVESGILSKIVLFLSSVFSGVWSGFFVPAMLIRLAESIYSLMQVEDIGVLFSAVANYISGNRQELVCDLYLTRGNASGWENFLIDKVFGSTSILLEYANSSSMWLTALTWLVPDNLGAQMLFGGHVYPVSSPVPCDCVLSDGVWTFVQSGDTQILSVGWDTLGRVSFTAQNERNSEFSGGYTQAQLDLQPELLNPSTLTVNVLVDTRTEGMSQPECSLASGVGVYEGSFLLSLGENIIPIEAGVNRINITSDASRHVSGVQEWTFDSVLEFSQNEV